MDMERRELLLLLGVGGSVGVSTLVGASLLDDRPRNPPMVTPTERPEPVRRHADEFGTVVDAVAAGADPNGEEPINPFLEEYAADDTLLSFPEGTYRFQPIDLTGYRHLGIAAAGETPPTFAAETGRCLGSGNQYILFDRLEEFLLDNVVFDFDGESTGGELRMNLTGDATITDVSASGGCAEQVAMCRIDVLDADATAVVENLTIDNRSDGIALTGVYVGKHHTGTVAFRNCDVQGFTDNGLYASAPGLEDGGKGIVRVEGGTYRNNNISNVRLGSEGSVARDVTSISDAPPPTTENSPPANARGFRLRTGRGQLIEDCTVRITENSRFTHGGIVFHQTNGGATVRNTSIEIDRNDTPAIRTFPRDNEHSGTPRFAGLKITGNASAGQTVLLEGRDETVFSDCTIEQTGSERNGIYVRNSENCRIVDSRIDVTRNPLVLRGSSVRIENSTFVTPDGTEEIDDMRASDGDFTPRGTR
jgi:hypothetical protein